MHDTARTISIGACMVQAPMLLLLMVYYPEPKVVVYTARMLSGNLTYPEVSLDADEYGLAVIYIAVSACVVLFASMTLQMQEAQLIDNMTEYFGSDLASLYVWDCTMWATVCVAHALLSVQICSPVDLYLVALAALLQAASLRWVCSGSKFQSVAMGGYLAAMGLVLMQAHHGLRLVVWCVLAMADLLLAMGHTFEAQVNLETIANCRMCYHTLAGLLLLFLYTV